MIQNSNGTLYILLIIAVVIIIALFVGVIMLYRKIKHLTTPRYGFLGKPLYIVALVLMATATIYMAVNINKTNINDINAQKDIRIAINYELVSTNDQTATVNFLATPYINNIDWGNENEDKFDIYWDISGLESYSKVQTNITKSTKNDFNLSIKKGNYQVNVLLIYNGKPYSESRTASF